MWIFPCVTVSIRQVVFQGGVIGVKVDGPVTVEFRLVVVLCFGVVFSGVVLFRVVDVGGVVVHFVVLSVVIVVGPVWVLSLVTVWVMQVVFQEGVTGVKVDGPVAVGVR